MRQYATSQLLPIVISLLTCTLLGFLLFGTVNVFNYLPTHGKITLQLRLVDILVGATIYLKTAIDFALFMGSLIYKHQGVKNRIAIEIGTALGNGIGTLLILTIWVFFKEIPILLVLMIIVASLVLLRMAEDGLRDYFETPMYHSLNTFLQKVIIVLSSINRITNPLFGKLLPDSRQKEHTHGAFWSLFFFAFTIPFLLGLDDFAGYIPLFTLVNVFGFAIGVYLGHMLLTASLFALPTATARFVRQPSILIAGSFVFLGLSIWGLLEAIRTVVQLIH